MIETWNAGNNRSTVYITNDERVVLKRFKRYGDASGVYFRSDGVRYAFQWTLNSVKARKLSK